jgi:asparagine synthase (glutamine-hydrolysing)
MCGICGQVRFDARPADEAVVGRMRDSLRHRGPDDEGLWSEAYPDGGVALGHTRLSIIDLSSAGHQPMSDPSGRFYLTYNGEIYNYREIRSELERDGAIFRTQTDTEVIPASYAKWGTACLSRFIGMFSFALWDRNTRRLFCARDRLGVKPFYYTLSGNVLNFASEIKALIKAGVVTGRPNERSVYDYLSFCLMDHRHETFFDGVQQLEPGTFIEYDGGALTPRRYWTLEPKMTSGAGDPVEKFRELFYDSVRLRLRSDVPVGILLSGGLDSSSIAAAAADILSPEKPVTFSSTMQGTGLDETEYSNSVARHIGARNTVLRPDGGGFWDELDTMLYAQDEPVHASDIYANWCMMRQVRAQGITVLLNGQGGDELFGGYGWYAKNLLASYLLRGDIISFAREFHALKKNPAGTMAASGVHLLANVVEALLPARVKRMTKQELAGMRAISRPRIRRAYGGFDTGNISLINAPAFGKKTENDLLFFNVPHYLHYEDRNSMHFSIEQRVPFLDHRLVEWAFGLPMQWKIRRGISKYVVRRAMENRLPGLVVNRPDKMGLSIPIETWMKRELAEKFMHFFHQDCYIYSHWIDRQSFLKELDIYMRGGRTQITRLLWRVFSLEKWAQLFLT